jgi:hypothetical protein
MPAHATVDADDVVATNVGMQVGGDPLRFIQDTDADIDAVIDPGILEILPGVPSPGGELLEDDLGLPFAIFWSRSVSLSRSLLVTRSSGSVRP